MSKCVVCGREYEAKRSTSRYCSGKCRKASQRKVSGTGVPVKKVSGTKVLPKKELLKKIFARYELVPGEKVYGRPAVRFRSFPERWDLRPEPLSPDDMPKPLKRGRYIRPDGSEYRFDAVGKAWDIRFECNFGEGGAC